MNVKLKDSKIAQYASLGAERAGLCASRAFFVAVVFARAVVCPFLPWCRGSAAVCGCGIPWTFFY